MLDLQLSLRGDFTYACGSSRLAKVAPLAITFSIARYQQNACIS